MNDATDSRGLTTEERLDRLENYVDAHDLILLQISDGSTKLEARSLIIRDAQGQERITLETTTGGGALIAVRHPDDPDQGVFIDAGRDKECESPAAVVTWVGPSGWHEINEHCGGLPTTTDLPATRRAVDHARPATPEPFQFADGSDVGTIVDLITDGVVLRRVGELDVELRAAVDGLSPIVTAARDAIGLVDAACDRYDIGSDAGLDLVHTIARTRALIETLVELRDFTEPGGLA